MNPDPRFHACIIAGGSGERFWPMSRTAAPKHLLRLFSERTLLEDAVERLRSVVLGSNMWILTNEAQVPLVREALPWFPKEQIVAEPAKRDTAPAAALATAIVRSRDPKGVLAILPADSLIGNAGRYSQQLSQALTSVAGDSPAGAASSLLTFAVTPSYPATGFGYLEMGEDLGRGADGSLLRRVARFEEKPDKATAERYVSGGRHAWNAGMFVWSVERFLHEAAQHAPQLAAFVRDFPKGDASAFIRERFAALPKNSIDYALMEKASSVATVVAEFEWDDVGSWTALPRHLGEDPDGIARKGSVVSVDSRRSIAVSNGRLIALCGVDDLVVVETPDAVLVCHRDRVQDIKKLMAQLPEHHR